MNNEEWREDALCPQTDPALFYPEKGEHWSVKPAKKICLKCPVRLECLQYALDHDEQYGIWGGLTERERRRHRHGIPVQVLANLKPCGTVAAYQRHIRYSEKPCTACRTAWNQQQKIQYETKSAL